MSTEAPEVVEQPQPASEAPAKAEAPKVEPGVQKRIDQMTFKYREEQRQRQALEAKLAEYESKAKQAPPPEAEKRKTLADFSYDDVAYEDYLAERVTKRASETAAKEATKAVEEREQKKAQETTAAERAKAWKERADAFAKDHPDFVERVYGDDLPFTDAVAELVADSDIGPQLAYHLAQNPDDLARLSKLSPAAAGREIGKLEAKLQAQAKPADSNASAATKEPATTKAPPPPPKIEGSTGTIEPDEEKMSADQWRKHREKQIAARQKRA